MWWDFYFSRWTLQELGPPRETRRAAGKRSRSPGESTETSRSCRPLDCRRPLRRFSSRRVEDGLVSPKPRRIRARSVPDPRRIHTETAPYPGSWRSVTRIPSPARSV